MKMNRLIVVVFTLLFSIQAAGQGWKWAVGSTCNSSGFVDVYKTVMDNKGNLYIAGFSDSISVAVFGPQTLLNPGEGLLLFVSKVDTSGHYLWTKAVGNGNSNFIDIAVDTAGNLYVYGQYTLGSNSVGPYNLVDSVAPYMAFLAKLDPLGNFVFAENVAPVSGIYLPYYLGGMDVDQAGNVYMYSQFDSTINLGSTILPKPDSGYTFFLATFNALGSPVLAKRFWCDGFVLNGGIKVTTYGNIYIDGIYVSRDFKVGMDSLYGTGAFLSKFDHTYNPLWTKRIASSQDIEELQLAKFVTDSTENVYLTGEFIDTIYMGGDTLLNPSMAESSYVEKLDSSGSVIFASVKGEPGQNFGGWGIGLDPCGDIWIVGSKNYSYISGIILDTLFITEFTTTGVEVKDMYLPSGGDDWCDILFDKSGNLYIGGDYAGGPFAVGTQVLPTGGYENEFIAKYRYFAPGTTYSRKDTVACAPGSFVLSGPPGFTNYQWSNGTMGLLDTVHGNGTYVVTATSTACLGTMAAIDTIQLTYIYPADTQYFHHDTTICSGDTIELNLPSGWTAYYWNNGVSGARDSINSTGVYWGISESPCTSRPSRIDTFYVTLKHVKQDTLTGAGDTVFCPGESITFFATPGFSGYAWSDGTTKGYDVQSAPGTYWVDCIARCPDSVSYIDTFHLALKHLDTVGHTVDTFLCPDFDVSLEAPAGYFFYLWSDSTMDSINTVSLPGTYFVYCFPICPDSVLLTDTFHVASYPVGLPFSLGTDTFACNAFVLHVPADGVSYTWQDGALGPSYLVSQTGNYFCTGNEDGCSYTSYLSVTIPVLTQGLRDTSVCTELFKELVVSANVPAGAECIWSTGNTDQKITVTQPGTYWVVVTDSSCSASDTMTLQTGKCKVVIHDVITPNGDGYNDTWTIEDIDKYPGNSVQVFDKWGTEVYRKNNYSNDWAGKGMNGHDLPDGTYFYLVKLDAINPSPGEKNEYTGAVLIKR